MLPLGRFQDVDFDSWRASAGSNPQQRILISASGYERRCTTWSTLLLDSHRELVDRFVVFGFHSHMDDPTRLENDRIYRKYGLKVTTGSEEDYLGRVLKETQSMMSGEDPIEVSVDYSSMPRSWYCGGFKRLQGVLRPHDSISFWYTPGHYQDGDYPSTGIQNFKVYDGRASAFADYRTHIFGLGFDRVRAQAIFSVLDPQNLICYYADPAIIAGYVDRVLEDNRDLLQASQHRFMVPLASFVHTYSRIVDAARSFRLLGDVVLVPEGPKPLILAASLVPRTVGGEGIVCFHVTRPTESPIVAVDPAANPVGFRFVRLSEAVNAAQ